MKNTPGRERRGCVGLSSIWLLLVEQLIDPSDSHSPNARGAFGFDLFRFFGHEVVHCCSNTTHHRYRVKRGWRIFSIFIVKTP